MKQIIFCLLFVFYFCLPLSLADLRIGFYDSTCPNAETIIRQVVQKFINDDKSIPAALLRLHFHDCFVRGCDASILIDPTSTKRSEKTAGPNLSVRGYELIDEAKKLIEAQCPSTVSCADIVTLATRDAVAFAGGPAFPVPTGRRDGLISDPSEVILPGPSFSVSQAAQSFKSKNLNLNDMVTLLGAHTIGVTHCNLFSDRTSDFRGTGKPDPSMDPVLATRLKETCGGSGEPDVFLDQNTSFVFDNQFYKEILVKRGVLEIDQEIANDVSTRGMVIGFASNADGFMRSFADAMVKMGSIEVLVGNSGEIRHNCRVFNPPPVPSPPPNQPSPSPPPTQNPQPVQSPPPSQPNPPIPNPQPVPSPSPNQPSPNPPTQNPQSAPSPLPNKPSPNPPTSQNPQPAPSPLPNKPSPNPPTSQNPQPAPSPLPNKPSPNPPTSQNPQPAPSPLPNKPSPNPPTSQNPQPAPSPLPNKPSPKPKPSQPSTPNPSPKPNPNRPHPPTPRPSPNAPKKPHPSPNPKRRSKSKTKRKPKQTKPKKIKNKHGKVKSKSKARPRN